jgi:hypothetical protein
MMIAAVIVGAAVLLVVFCPGGAGGKVVFVCLFVCL